MIVNQSLHVLDVQSTRLGLEYFSLIRKRANISRAQLMASESHDEDLILVENGNTLPLCHDQRWFQDVPRIS